MTRLEWLIEQMGQSVDDPNACQLWPFACGGYELSYGYVKFEGKQHLVHRVVWKLRTGEFPLAPLETRHKCGVGSCFNFYHLTTGTHSQNELDKAAHGTGKQGERHHNARLSEDDVRAIRTSTLSNIQLSDRYNVEASNIAHIRHRRSWKHVG